MISQKYKTLFISIKDRIRAAQYSALRTINKELINLYWDIGKMIIQKQKGDTWGKSIVERLSKDLQSEFPKLRGFSSQNLWRMKMFYEKYEKNEKLSPLVREISWSHNLVILDKCNVEREREFYLRMTKSMGWSKNALIHQIENQTYKKTALNQTNFKRTLPHGLKNKAKMAVKDEYVFDFLDLGEEYSERQFEKAILKKVERFIKEMGGVFSFMGSQFRLEVSNKEYFIDLLMYHRRLKCLIAIDLKIGEFLPEYVGKMQFYLAALDSHVKMNHENPSIGIILCKSKNKTIVEYALRESKKPIGVASYRIVSSLPKDLIKQLPAPTQVAKLLES